MLQIKFRSFEKDIPYFKKLKGRSFSSRKGFLMHKIRNDVKPFKALCYNPKKIDNLGLCLSQPYDVISPSQQDAYYAQHQFNVIRLILNRIEKTDTDANNRYTRARETLGAWKKEAILVHSERPAFFAYEQSFKLPGNISKNLTGYIGLVRLADYEEGRVLPHEKVLKRPVEDRISLTMTTGTQFEYIWGLYRDPDKKIDGILAGEKGKGTPLLDFEEAKTRVRHRLYRVTEPEKCHVIEETMKDKQIYIADGHHRYQTMLTVRDEMRKKYPDAGPDAPWEYIMMFLVNTVDPGLVILPTHRLLYGVSETVLNELVAECAKYFTVTRLPFEKNDRNDVQARWLVALEKAAQPAFGIAIQNNSEFVLIELKEIKAYKKLITEKATETWQLLDVNVLNILILQKIAGITEEMMSLQKNIEYVKDADEALARVASGEMQAAFILKGTPLEAVLAVAAAGEKMPRKSTFFYPKPLSGLVFFEMDKN
jgi:uncharacterized protein (DUF1015 family)